MITYQETAALLVYLSRLNPAMRVVEGMAQAWFDQLQEFTAADVQAAARKVGGQQTWVGVADIRRECKRLRADRVHAVDVHALVQLDPIDDPAGYHREYLRLHHEIANGIRNQRGQLEGGR